MIDSSELEEKIERNIEWRCSFIKQWAAYVREHEVDIAFKLDGELGLPILAVDVFAGGVRPFATVLGVIHAIAPP